MLKIYRLFCYFGLHTWGHAEGWMPIKGGARYVNGDQCVWCGKLGKPTVKESLTVQKEAK